MPTGVYPRTIAHRKAVVRGKREAEAARANGSEASTSRRRAAVALADFTSEQIADAVKCNDFALARAWLDLSESISKSE